MSDESSKLERNYKLLAIALGLVSLLALSTTLSIISRLIPVLIPGGGFLQLGTLLTSLVVFLVTRVREYRLLAAGIFGAIFFSLVAGWWDALYLCLLAFKIGEVNGINILMSTGTFLLAVVLERIYQRREGRK
jgi:hypothetical protein